MWIWRLKESKLELKKADIILKLQLQRRYLNGIKNLFEIYLPIADEVMIFDNSEGKHDLIAKKTLETELYVFSETKFNKLKKYYNANT